MGRGAELLRDDRGVFPLSELTARGARDFGERPAMRSWNGKQYVEITYNELHRRTKAIARWLIAEGVKPGDHIAILGDNSPQWEMSYLGIQMAGAVCIPVDRLLPPSGMRHVLTDSGSRMLFAGASYLETLEEVAKMKCVEKLICTVGKAPADVVPLNEVIKRGDKLKHELPRRSLDELAAILYTSGTTGHSKGVMLTQRNLVSNTASASRIFPVGPDDVFLSVLPVHHSFEATTGFLLALYCGSSITFAISLKSNDIISGIKDTGVTIMIGVPLLYEKMMQGIQRGIKKKGKEKLVNTLMRVVKMGKKIGLSLGGKLFKGLREKAGFSTIRFFVSGGGPLDPEVALFFNRLGMTMLQGYGLTETSPVTHAVRPNALNNVTVGPPIPGVEHMILDPNDQGVGEICIKGPNVFKGYYKKDDATREVFTDDGWFKTGDLGLVHPDNSLQITGRKKAMLVTGGGKNVYPEEIEFYLNRSHYIAESVVLGIPRAKGMGDEVGALIHPDYEQVDLYFEQKGIAAPMHEDVHELIKKEIRETQKNLADYKRIRTFRVFEEEFQKTTKRTIKRFLYSHEMLDVNGGRV